MTCWRDLLNEERSFCEDESEIVTYAPSEAMFDLDWNHPRLSGAQQGAMAWCPDCAAEAELADDSDQRS